MLGRRGYVAVIQRAEGVPADPVLVPVAIKGTTITFEWAVGDGDILKYQGTIRRDGLYGRFESGERSDRADGYFLLKRGRSYWQ
jgi:hypothetical protein